MDYAKKTIILTGEAEARFTMQRSGFTVYSLKWIGEPRKEDIFVFCGDEVFRLKEENGTLPVDISQVNAVAVGENFAAKGQLGPFSWPRARALLARNNRKEKEAVANAKKQPLQKPLSEEKAENTPDICEEPQHEEENPLEVPQKQPEQKDAPPMGKTLQPQDPFEGYFGASRWYKHEFPSAKGGWGYLSGELLDEKGGVYATALALPGASSARPACGGFKLYRKATDGNGYWIRINKL